MGVEKMGTRDIIGIFGERIEQSKDLAWPFKIGMEMLSDQASETYKWLGMSPMLREWKGGKNAKGLRDFGLTIKNLEFEATLELASKDMRRDKTGQIEIRIADLAKKASSHWAKLLSVLVMAGDSQVCYDGQYFFDTDHSEGDSGVLSNKLTSSDYSDLAVVDSSNPTAEEIAKIMLKLTQHMFSFLDDQGEPMNEDAREFVLMVPIAMWSPAIQAVKKNFLSTGSGVIDNPTQNDEVKYSIVPNPRFSAGTELYLFRADGNEKPFILQSEKEIELKVLGEKSEHEFKTGNQLFGVEASRNVGFGLWQQGIKATLSDA